MGYNIHVTRNDDWWDEEGEWITLQEWLDYIAQDPEMRHDGGADADASDGVVLNQLPGFAIWTAYSGGDPTDALRNRYWAETGQPWQPAEAWIAWDEGQLYTKNPDAEVCAKLYRIAQHFGAKVKGDEGEAYGPRGEVLR